MHIISHVHADWHFVAPKSHPIYRGDGSNEPQSKIIGELADYIGKSISIDLLTNWFGIPKRIDGETVQTPEGYLLTRLLYRKPMVGAVGPNEICEQYIFELDADTKLYFLRSRWHDDPNWRSIGYIAAKWIDRTNYIDTSVKDRNAWEKNQTEKVLALLRSKMAEQAAPRNR